MQAAQYYGREDVRIEDVDTQTLGPGDVRIDVAACGVCGTDITQYVKGPLAVPVDEPHPVTGRTLPITLGHELSGVVAEVGEDIATASVGDRVTVNPLVPCRTCSYCLRGQYRFCEQLANIGLHGNGGGFAESLVAPASSVHGLPTKLPLDLGALVEPLSVSLHAVRRSGIAAGDSIIVFGSGPIGLGVVQMARAAGARRVFVSEPRDRRRRLAAELGATTVFDPSETDPVASIRDRTGVGVDASVEAAGTEATVNAAIETTRKGGEIVSLAAARDVTIQPNEQFVMTERSLTGSFGYDCTPFADDGEFAGVMTLLADGRVDGETMVTHRIGLSDLVGGGLERLADPDGDAVKILVSPDR